jgi:2-polyprenyl-3-methyl-5-hydroxy-6-metoxy-1,4-benzoquinol methylase
MPSPCPHPPPSQQLLFGARDFITGDRFRIELCENCGIAFTRPAPAAADLPKYYPPAYYGGGSKRFPAFVEQLQCALYRRRAAKVEQILGGKGKVLDIGCGPGFLLHEFRARGWDVHGTEFSEQSAAHACNALGLPVSIGDVAALQFGAASFDAVILWHVLEHMPDPHATIAEAARLLRPDGILLCAVPNFGSLEARFAQDNWFHLDVPRHLNHFTATALTTLLAVHNLALTNTSFFALEYDCFSFTQSVLNSLGLRHNLLYNVLRGAQAKVFPGRSTPAWQTVGSVALAASLGLLSVPLTALAAALRTGATAAVYARKR